MIPSIAWKNIWRNRTRSLVVIVAIALGLFGGLFASSFMLGMADERVSEGIRYETPELKVEHPKFEENLEPHFCITNADQKIVELKKLPLISGVSPREVASAMVQTATTSSGITLFGVDPEKEKTVSMLYQTIWDSTAVRKNRPDIADVSQFVADSCGEYLSDNQHIPIIIGEKLAHKLKVKVRSKLVITMQNYDGTLTGGAFRVVGIFRTSNTQFEEGNAFVLRSDLSALMAVPENTVSQLALRLKSRDQLSIVDQQVTALFPKLKVVTWQESDPILGMIDGLMLLYIVAFLVIILLALGFVIVNTMLMVILERVRELGMLMAIGMSKGRVFSMIMVETVLLTTTGGVVGMMLGYGTVMITGHTGINLSSVSQGLRAMGYSPMVYPHIDIFFLLMVTALVLITGLVASIFPAIRALKLKPVEALRQD
ncbi:MAG TPA: FtsX-like permease family protein [Williamwhitmania sp.]|nr:FtsX-like permease family protein [Williamwhitmania sp.]